MKIKLFVFILISSTALLVTSCKKTTTVVAVPVRPITGLWVGKYSGLTGAQDARFAIKSDKSTYVEFHDPANPTRYTGTYTLNGDIFTTKITDISNANNTYTFVGTFKNDGTLTGGTWGSASSSTDGGTWNANRIN